MVFFTITNKKAADAGASTTRVILNGSSVDVHTQAIVGGGSVGGSGTVPGVCFDPDLDGSITADINGELAENDEDNNVDEFFILGLPDLQATFDGFTEGINGTTFGLSELRATAGESFFCRIDFTITNVKAADAGASTTRVTKDGSGDAFVLTPAIPGGDSHSDSAIFPGPCFDAFDELSGQIIADLFEELSGQIIADFFEEVTESDETNNVDEFFFPGGG
jgi:hypothetical protein